LKTDSAHSIERDWGEKIERWRQSLSVVSVYRAFVDRAKQQAD